MSKLARRQPLAASPKMSGLPTAMREARREKTERGGLLDDDVVLRESGVARFQWPSAGPAPAPAPAPVAVPVAAPTASRPRNARAATALASASKAGLVHWGAVAT